MDRSHLKRLWRPGVRKWYSKNGHCCEAKDFLMARHSCVHLIFWHFANIRNLNKKIMVINRGFLQTWSGFFLVGFHPLYTIWLRCFRCYAEHGEGKLSSCKNYVGIPCMRPFWGNKNNIKSRLQDKALSCFASFYGISRHAFHPHFREIESLTIIFTKIFP